MRVLVTGSRTWTDEVAVIAALEAAVEEFGPITVVHGGCPTGADSMAHRWAKEHDVAVEVHLAQWELQGRAAGPIRNKKMVDSGVGLCLAFLNPASRGAVGCAGMAHKAGVPTRRFEAD